MYKYILFLFFFNINCFAFEYGKVRIVLAQSKNKHEANVKYLQEQSNDLIDSNGFEISYLYLFKENFRIGTSLKIFSSEISEYGEKVKNDLLSNGIKQNLELRQMSLFLLSNYRIGNGIMKFFGQYQSQVYFDINAGVGATSYKNSKDDANSRKFGWLYGAELGMNLNADYIIALNFSKIKDDLSGNTDLGIKIGYTW